MPDHPSNPPLKAPDGMVPLAGVNAAAPPAGSWRRHGLIFDLFVLGLCACFARPLLTLAAFSAHSDFFSYIPLIPIISIYLVWLKKSECPRLAAGFSIWGALAAVAGFALLIGWKLAERGMLKPDPENYLTVTIAAFTLFLTAGCLIIFGNAFGRVMVFPMAFLVFMIPMPLAMLNHVEYTCQVASAIAASGMLKLAGMTLFRDDVALHLPGFTIIVAPECSGIHSTMVLLITSTLAADLFLRSRWRRLALVLFVFPLAILRNGFRIFVISELCVQVSHDMIDSPIHHKGGPIFFALSLIPFFAFLWYLRKTELPGSKTVNTQAKV